MRNFLLGAVLGGAVVAVLLYFAMAWRKAGEERPANPVAAPGSTAPNAPAPAPATAPSRAVNVTPSVTAPARVAEVPAPITAPRLPMRTPEEVARNRLTHAADLAAPPVDEAHPKATLPVDGVRDAIAAATPAIKRCYEQALAPSPGLAGKLVVKFTIATRDRVGRLKDAEIQEDTMGQPFVGMCALKAIAEVEFPAPEGDGEVTVTYPFRFVAAE